MSWLNSGDRANEARSDVHSPAAPHQPACRM